MKNVIHYGLVLGLMAGLLTGCTSGEEEPASTTVTESVIYEDVQFADTMADLKSMDLQAGDRIRTLGYYSPEDQGGALYRILDDSQLTADGVFVHELENGLKAQLVVENNTINIRQLGARADYTAESGGTDNYAVFAAAFESDVAKVDLAGGSYFIGSGQRLTVDRAIEIDGQDATLVTDSGLLFHTNVDAKAIVHDLDLQGKTGETHEGIGIEVVNQVEGDEVWGGSVDLSNVDVMNFAIGFKGDSLFQTRLDTVRSIDNTAGFYFTGSSYFSNLNENNAISALNNTYGIILENYRNASFENSIIEYNDYGVVVDRVSHHIAFRNTWFEKITSAPVVFGEIDPETLELTASGVTNTQVAFTDNRWSQVETESETFYDESTLFTARYREVDGSGRDFDALMAAGIAYTNLAEGNFTVDYQSGGDVTTGREETPFGEKQVTKITGADAESLFISFPVTAMEPGHVYLVKYKVRLNQAATVHTGIPVSPKAEQAISLAAQVEPNAWTEVSTILQLKDSLTETETSRLAEEGTVGFAVTERDNDLDLEATDPAIYDLTAIFGAGNEPDTGLNETIGPYFQFVGFQKSGKTGNF